MSKPLHGVRRLALSAAMRLLGACDAAQSAWQCAKKDVHMARADFVENKIRKELLSAPAIGFASAQKMIAKSNNGSWGEAGWAGASQACSRFMAAAGPEQLRDLSVEIAAGGAEAKIFFAREAVKIIHASIECSRIKVGERAPIMMIAMEGLAEQDSSELQARAKFVIRKLLPATFNAADGSPEDQKKSIAEIARIGRWLLNEQSAGRDLVSWAREKVLDREYPCRVEMKGELYKAWQEMALAHPELARELIGWCPEREGGDYQLLAGALRSELESRELSRSCEAPSMRRKRASAL